MNEDKTLSGYISKTITNVGVMFLSAWILMLLWDGLVVDRFGVEPLLYWHAMGYKILVSQFFPLSMKNKD
jgi:hypothetical protein